MDETDIEIIKILQKSSKIPVKEIAKKINLSYTAAFMRILKLEKNGVIEKYAIRLDEPKIGRNFRAFITVRVDQHKNDPIENVKLLTKLKEVETIDFISGDWDIIIRVGLKDIDHLREFINKKLPHALPNATCSQPIVILEHHFKEMEPLL